MFQRLIQNRILFIETSYNSIDSTEPIKKFQTNKTRPKKALEKVIF